MKRLLIHLKLTIIITKVFQFKRIALLRNYSTIASKITILKKGLKLYKRSVLNEQSVFPKGKTDSKEFSFKITKTRTIQIILCNFSDIVILTTKFKITVQEHFHRFLIIILHLSICTNYSITYVQ